MFRTLLVLSFLAGANAASAQSPDAERAPNVTAWQAMFAEYPAASLAAREQGTVGFEVKLDSEGFGRECQVIQSSGFERLDDETCRFVLNRAVFKGLVGPDGRRRAAVTQGVVNWVLPDLETNAAVKVAHASSLPKFRMVGAAASAKDKRVCKRQKVTGTLAGYERVCMTAHQWDEMRRINQEEWGALQGTKGSTKGN